MGRILYIVYLWLFFVPVFLVLTILTAVTVIIGCLSVSYTHLTLPTTSRV